MRTAKLLKNAELFNKLAVIEEFRLFANQVSDKPEDIMSAKDKKSPLEKKVFRFYGFKDENFVEGEMPEISGGGEDTDASWED